MSTKTTKARDRDVAELLKTVQTLVATLAGKDGSDLADITDMEADALRGVVVSLANRLAKLESAIDELRETPQDPRIVPRLVRRDMLFAEGAQLEAERVAAARRLHEARKEYHEADAAFERCRNELESGGPFKDGAFEHTDADALRADLKRLNAEREELWEAVQNAEAELRRCDDALRPFTTVYTYGLALGDVEVQA